MESVSSLLTLRYPDFEVIVVNDGSRDGTLRRLVDYFELERTDLFVHRYLATEKIRGIYASKRYPELLVIDKANGGKADSLNAGINVARKEYFAGIDADSMLERDALLALAGKFLASEEEVVAAGGNILPVNGCTVRQGDLVQTRIPRRAIARFQTIEYLRAFMAGTGRLGRAEEPAHHLGGLRPVPPPPGGRRPRLPDAQRALPEGHGGRGHGAGGAPDPGLAGSGAPFAIQYAYRRQLLDRDPRKPEDAQPPAGPLAAGAAGHHLLSLEDDRQPPLRAHGPARLSLLPAVRGARDPGSRPKATWPSPPPWRWARSGCRCSCCCSPPRCCWGCWSPSARMIIAEHRRDYFPLRDKLLLVLYAVAGELRVPPALEPAAGARLPAHDRARRRLGTAGAPGAGSGRKEVIGGCDAFSP